MRLCLAICCVLVLGARELQAQDCFKTDSRVGAAAFVMPTGWKRVDGRDVTTLVPGDLPQGRVAQISLLAAQPLSGDLRSWFDAQWAEWEKQFKAVDGYDPQISAPRLDRKSTRLNSSHTRISYAAFCFKKKH